MSNETWITVGLIAAAFIVAALLYAHMMAKAAEFFDEWEDR